ncbi:hypothetical protein HBB16_07445 [Pseudonocardia sp. MCCB 268]|nr:hypothetical protein [Pseudonocardia cytotoxica]
MADNVSVTWLARRRRAEPTRCGSAPGGLGLELLVMFQTGEGGPFRDARARQAACMALDPPRIDEALYRGVRLTGQESPSRPAAAGGTSARSGATPATTANGPPARRQVVASRST